MRLPRYWQTESGYYRCFHCVSRFVERRFAFGEAEREHFGRLLRRVEAFSGVRVLTWTILSNHFHVLLLLPAPGEAEALSDGDLVGRIAALYGRRRARVVEAGLRELARSKRERAAGERLALRGRYLYRMGDLGEFMKTLKQRFSMWFNGEHGRVGTLWEERFKSVVVGGSRASVLTVAAYIDLNCVRAGLARDPKDYRWCGYAEAVAGRPEARRGLGAVLESHGGDGGWEGVGPEYRLILFGRGGAAFDPGRARGVLAEGGVLSRGELLRCRVGYFTRGAVLGTREFVDGFFERRREWFGERREDGARAMRGGDWGGMASLRDLRREVITLERFDE